jgi:hypothetical protein
MKTAGPEGSQAEKFQKQPELFDGRVIAPR